MSRRRRSNRSIQRSPGGVNTGSEIRTTEFLDIVTDEAIIRRALNKSRLRMEILHSLNSGDKYLSEIARDIGSQPTNVQGALVGLGIRYAPELSLVSLGLVFQYPYGNRKYYGITDKGRQYL